MSIIIMLTITVLGWHAANAAARLLVEAIATVVGIALFAKAAGIHRRMLAMRGQCGGLDRDARPSRSERRLMAASLELAIRQTELRSLFPQVGLRCERLVSVWHHGRVRTL
ncbi:MULTISPECIES: hypothetical protein [unclassified Sphingomonas]|jgi:hypothetical protein|uniref:hypothetical protein n=1 Tax=unclassified Sphingomonas TaxID=196159 RepID=UPI000E102886|nr:MULTISPECIES: hypothetical protein [unclassified Sphingomonas]AXJ96335.1 hypothetical protein DM480_13365 [Sphingomonas sp. FARSPH]